MKLLGRIVMLLLVAADVVTQVPLCSYSQLVCSWLFNIAGSIEYTTEVEIVELHLQIEVVSVRGSRSPSDDLVCWVLPVEG